MAKNERKRGFLGIGGAKPLVKRMDKEALARIEAARLRHKEVKELQHALTLERLKLELTKVRAAAQEYYEEDIEEVEQPQDEDVTTSVVKNLIGGIMQNVSKRNTRTEAIPSIDEQDIDSDTQPVKRKGKGKVKQSNSNYI